MSSSFILGHLGLGDQIICNGLIRTVSQNSSVVHLPVKKHNIKNIKDMLKDLSNIDYLSVEDDQEMLKYLNLMERFVDNKISFGVFAKGFMKDVNTFDESFYKQAGFDYNLRWEKFYYLNDEEKQASLLKEIKEDFIFLHDDHSRNLIIKEQLLNKQYKVFRPDHNLGSKSDYTLFDYIKVLESAKEIHCMDSSFACLIDHLPSLKYKPKFIHRYIRKNNNNPFYKNNWNIYE